MNKCIWLARLLNSHPQGMTRAAILEAWRDEDDQQRPMAPSTFYDNCQYLATRFGIQVERKGNLYRLQAGAGAETNSIFRIIGQDSTPESTLNMPGSVTPDDATPGARWLPLMVTAVMERRRMVMTYAPPGKEAYDTWLCPYVVKQIHGLCYVVGHSSHHGALRTFALDRITALNLQGGTFRRTAESTVKGWFADSFGAFGGPGLRPERLVVRATTPRMAAYLRQRPLHPSQQPLSGDACRFALHMAVTPDLVGQMLAFGPDLCVEEPQALKNEIGRRAAAIAALAGE